MIVQFTHTDLDGVGCAAIAHLYAAGKGSPIITYYCEYDTVNQKVNDFLDNNPLQGLSILISDISVDEETGNKLEVMSKAYGFKNLLVDHHQTAEHLNKYTWAKIVSDGTESGTSLLAKCMFDESVQSVMSFADAVKEYDLWLFDKEKLTLSKQLNYMCHMMSHTAFIKYVCDIINEAPYGFFKIDDPFMLDMIQYKEDQSNEYAKIKTEKTRIIDFEGHKIGVVFAENNISLTGNTIMQKYSTEIDYAAVVDLANNCVHLRGLEHSPNLGTDIAKPHGGGGHPMAAAYHINDLNEEFIKTIMEEKKEENESIHDDSGNV